MNIATDIRQVPTMDDVFATREPDVAPPRWRRIYRVLEMATKNGGTEDAKGRKKRKSDK